MELPTYVQIEPVGQCNLPCEMCPIQFRKDGPPYGGLAFMKWETFTSLLDGFPELKKLHLQGLGEPMMHPRFFDMVRYACEKGIQVTINTNLTLLNPERTKKLVKRAHFDKVVHNAEPLLEIRKQLNSESPHLALVMVIMRQNLHELPELVKFEHRWSAEKFFVQHLSHDFGEPTLPDEYRPMREYIAEQSLAYEDPQRINHYFGEARELAESLGVNLHLPSITPKKYEAGTPGRDRCDWPWTGA